MKPFLRKSSVLGKEGEGKGKPNFYKLWRGLVYEKDPVIPFLQL